jgi:hypothetical protein
MIFLQGIKNIWPLVWHLGIGQAKPLHFQSFTPKIGVL